MLMRNRQKCWAVLGAALMITNFFGCQKNTVISEVVSSPSAAVSELQATAAPVSETYIEYIAPETERPTPIPTPTEVPTPSPTPSPSPTPEPTPEPTPHAVDSTLPKRFGYTSELAVGKKAVSEFSREQTIRFVPDSEYSDIPGVVTLRGGNYRINPAYGTVPKLNGNLTVLWSVPTKGLAKGDSGSGSWTGNGWTGQCLMVQWPESTRRIMNLYDSYKEKDGWIEVIYASMDGYVYFLDAETGKPTRDKLNIGMPFKGAGALDPRGIPVLYVGSGDNYSDKDSKKTRAMAYSLIDFTRLWEVGKAKDSFALRKWHAYDSSVLIDAASDTALIPGENGIFYTLHMNTEYDEESGTLTMSPDEPVKQRYRAPRLGDGNGKYDYGYESSAVGWKNYAFLCDNGGFMRCIELNTMTTVWVQDIADDVNSTPALEETEDAIYLYVGNTIDNTADKNKQGTASFYKINGMTGEIVWQYKETVGTTSHITGGVMTSAVLGKHSLSGLVYAAFSSTNGKLFGHLYAFDTETGEIVWSYKLGSYTWSSPLALYTDEGEGYIFLLDHTGKAYLLDGLTGSVLTTLKLSENIEASPCAFGDLIVIGTRGRHIFGIRVS